MPIILSSLFGLLVGVIVNRAADNLPPPARRSLLAAPHCPNCNQPRGIQQFAVLSYLLMRGRCPYCSSPVPLRAPLVEIVTALVFADLWLKFGATWQLVVWSVFTFFLLVIFVIDFEHRLILDVTSLPALVLALVLAPITLANALSLPALAVALGLAPPTFDWSPWVNAYASAVLGAVIGLVGGLAMYVFGAFAGTRLLRARGETGSVIPFGQGDVKLAAFVGALLGGLFPALQMLVITILLGGVGAVAIIAFNLIVRHRYDPAAVMPYGPYFVLAAFYFLLR